MINKDYTYCLNSGYCIHRKGCKRWIGNYSDKESIEIKKNIMFINDESCISEDKNSKMPYDMLDRFRNSDGSELI